MSHESRVFLSGIGVEGWTADSSYTYGKREAFSEVAKALEMY